MKENPKQRKKENEIGESRQHVKDKAQISDSGEGIKGDGEEPPCNCLDSRPDQRVWNGRGRKRKAESVLKTYFGCIMLN